MSGKQDGLQRELSRVYNNTNRDADVPHVMGNVSAARALHFWKEFSASPQGRLWLAQPKFECNPLEVTNPRR